MFIRSDEPWNSLSKLGIESSTSPIRFTAKLLFPEERPSVLKGESSLLNEAILLLFFVVFVDNGRVVLCLEEAR